MCVNFFVGITVHVIYTADNMSVHFKRVSVLLQIAARCNIYSKNWVSRLSLIVCFLHRILSGITYL